MKVLAARQTIRKLLFRQLPDPILAAALALLLASPGTGNGGGDSGGGNQACHGRYSLCSSARCTVSADGLTADCHCKVLRGWSIGDSGCDEREQKILSAYSLADFPELPLQTCPGASVPWASCLDAHCRVDPDDETKSLCTCEVKRSKDYGATQFQFQSKSCAAPCSGPERIWSAATPAQVIVGSAGLAKKAPSRFDGITYCPNPPTGND